MPCTEQLSLDLTDCTVQSCVLAYNKSSQAFSNTMGTTSPKAYDKDIPQMFYNHNNYIERQKQNNCSI